MKIGCAFLLLLRESMPEKIASQLMRHPDSSPQLEAGFLSALDSHARAAPRGVLAIGFPAGAAGGNIFIDI
ncbi:hypothetical protein [Cellvibrio fontiphilus]|uniref:Uncharacterized protein n=1 Tax=Cellvibrio fontiphilus TaxID=1815559 RepID=A0ABV7FEZ0_9GAMM